MAILASARLWAFDAATDRELEGTAFSSQNSSSAYKAFDGDAATNFSTTGDKMQYVGLDLGSQHVITRISFMPVRTSYGPDRMLLSIFEGANSPDFMDAIPLYLISEKPASGVMTSIDVNVSRGFRYVRYVGGSGSYCNVAELRFYGHEGEGDDSHFYQITNLPTVSIHVQDNVVPTERKVDWESVTTVIHENGTEMQQHTALTRVRGNYSATPENKPYRIKFTDGKHHMLKGSSTNESPVKAKKWVLLNSWRDKTLMRNPVAWYNSQLAGPKFTPWNQAVDLILNGDYRGTYILADPVDVHPGRIEITEMTSEDTEGEALTGGYFVEVDNNAGREVNWFTSSHGNPISIHDPDEDILNSTQFKYVRDAFNQMEERVYSSNYTDQEEGYRPVLDLESFLRYFLISEFNGNTDMLCQVFMYKERGDDHFYTGPVWDHELALDDDSGTFPANDREDWTYTHRCTGNWTDFVRRVLSDPSAMAELQQMWAKLRDDSLFTVDKVAYGVDSLRREMRASANLNFIRWPYLNQYISLTPAIRGTWDAEVDVVRDYVKGRIRWMDRKLGYDTLEEENGIYYINTPRDFALFSQMVAGGQVSAKAKLQADIDMADYSDRFVIMGTTTKPFTGSIDGDGHTIRNLHVTGKSNVGLIGVCGAGVTVTNLHLDSSCRFQGETAVGGFIGNARTGTVKITGCGSAATVIASGAGAGAFIGQSALLAIITFTNCYNVGSVSASSKAGAFIAPFKGKLTVTNCYNAGSVTGTEDGHEFAFGEKQLTITNCYDTNSLQVEPTTPDAVACGELCYVLNAMAESTYWHQNLDNGRTPDSHPVPFKTSALVYHVGEEFTNHNQSSAGYRYYKWEVSHVQGGDNGVLQFSEFDILDAQEQEVPGLYCYAGSQECYNNEGWVNAADNNTRTKFCGPFRGHCFFLFDAGACVTPSAYRIYTANDTKNYPDRNPSTWNLYGSNVYTEDLNDASWELIDDRHLNNTMGATNYTPYDFSLELPGATLDSITLSADELSLQEDETVQLSSRIHPEGLSNVGLFWRSSDSKVVSVTQNGLVVARSAGEAVITVTAPNFGKAKATCNVKVKAILRGDVNGDSVVDGADLVALINIVCGHPSVNSNCNAADMNRDGKVDFSDAEVLISVILDI